jgi:hypothetical protein
VGGAGGGGGGGLVVVVEEEVGECVSRRFAQSYVFVLLMRVCKIIVISFSFFPFFPLFFLGVGS